MSKIVEIAKRVGRFEIGANEWREIIGVLRGKPNPNSNSFSFRLDIGNLAARYYANAVEIASVLSVAQKGVAQKDLYVMTKTLALITSLELIKLAYGKTFEYASHGPWTQYLDDKVSDTR